MSSLALGNPTVGYSYQYAAKGSTFNQVLYNILAPGIYNGGGLSFSGNQIIVNAYDALFPSSSQLIAVHTTSSINLSSSVGSGGYGLGDITSSLPYIAMYFIWSDAVGVYPDYGFYDASIINNGSYLVLGRATFTGSSVSGFDYSSSTYPPVYNSTSKVLNIKGTENSSSTSTGSIVALGGVGVAKNVSIGGSLNVVSNTNISGVLNSTGAVTGLSTIQGTQLKSTVATGTMPITVNSITKVTNLNADQVDGYDADQNAVANNIAVRTASGGINVTSVNGTSLNISGVADITGAITGSSTIQGTQLKSTVATGTAPMTVVSTTKVTNLNADMLDNYHVAETNTPNTIALRNDDGYIYGSLAGNANTSSFSAGYPSILAENGPALSSNQTYTYSKNGYILLKLTSQYADTDIIVNGITVRNLYGQMDGRFFFPVKGGVPWKVVIRGAGIISWVAA